MGTTVWSKGDVLARVGNVFVTEFAEGDAVSITLTDDDTTLIKGANGSGAICYRSSNVCEVTINVLQSSEDNDRIQAEVQAILTARRGSLPIEISDGRGNTRILMPQGAPKKRPDVPFGDDAGVIAWVFHGLPEVYSLGGNELS